ncbi:SLAP domain-containing protein [Cytobacillus firmus]|uniref:5'-nucleotidase n=1 Tax=Cytobacillus firmus DS1 TaxID=1307436 RepID=W7LAX8_CYTFI|nr:SLAP domain-containing protein [Cytobacillus firmus]EWG08989.1 5'-nucleotidase [Cytobacillus firmus DS1]
MKKIVFVGAVTAALSLGAVMPFESSGLINPNKVEASVLATPLPVDLPLEYVSGVDEYGSKVSQYKIDIGNRTGTLLLKMYMTDKYPKGFADTLYADVKKMRASGFFLMDSNSALNPGDAKGLIGFDRYSPVYGDTSVLPTLKYTSGFQNVGTNKKGEGFIALGVYIKNKVNNGVYYLDTPNMASGHWNVKAYFYDNVNVEKQVFNEVNRYFPLLDKVRWGVAELKNNQIGRLTMLKNTPLLKETDGKFETARTLKKGEQYRIYGYKEINGKGYYAVGGGHFVETNPNLAKYETPAKNKLRLVKILHEE